MRETRDLVYDRGFIRITVQNVQIWMVRRKDDVSYVGSNDGIRLSVGHFRFQFQEFRSERPFDGLLVWVVVEGIEELLAQLVANRLLSGIGSRPIEERDVFEMFADLVSIPGNTVVRPVPICFVAVLPQIVL
ncbi:hypothetical protein [Saliphagus sp. LR7]|uniref:hypothetical protein n=1 Tax=Saliphagus sp. LR7 TaxID=2282654 RepID=UPI000DF79BA6|nr:hypothetical protein [Saliphagus sp. LR7]